MGATYAALLCVLFGAKCHLYEMMIKLYKVLDIEEVFTNRYSFDSLKCKQITWAIFEDSRSFFWKKVSPLDLVEGRLVEGVFSMLDDIMADVRYGRNVIRCSFPLAWQDTSNVYVPPTGLPPAPIHLSSNTNNPNPMSLLSPYAGVFGGGFNVPPPPPPQTLIQKLAHVAKTVREKFQEYHKKFGGRVLLSRLLQLGNIEIQKLPVLPELIDATTEKTTCAITIVWECAHTERIVTTKNLEGLCQQIEPGIAAAMKLSPASPSQILSCGPNQKNACR